MKNTVLGIIGCIIVLYTAMLSLGIYSLYIHKNQMEKCLSQVLYGVMDKYYLPHDTAETGGALNNTAARNDIYLFFIKSPPASRNVSNTMM